MEHRPLPEPAPSAPVRLLGWELAESEAGRDAWEWAAVALAMISVGLSMLVYG